MNVHTCTVHVAYVGINQFFGAWDWSVREEKKGSWRPGNSVEVWTCEGRGRHAASEYGDEEITWRRSLYNVGKKKR